MAFLKTNEISYNWGGTWYVAPTGGYNNTLYDQAIRFAGPIVADTVTLELYSRSSTSVNITIYVNTTRAIGGPSSTHSKTIAPSTLIALPLTSAQVSALNTSTPYIIMVSSGPFDLSYLGDSNDPALNYSTASDQPASGCKAWTGSKFADHLVKCWTGSKWEDQLVRFWNGSAWKDGN